MADERISDVEAVLQRLARWAEQQADVRSLALVGSWARGAPHGDSDVDLVLLTESPSRYVERRDWLGQVGGVRLMRTVQWGVITERRFAMANGFEVDLAVGPLTWASVHPLSAGTRQVVKDAMRALYDPDGLLVALTTACEPS